MLPHGDKKILPNRNPLNLEINPTGMRQVRDVLMKTEGKKNESSDPKKGIAVTGAQPTGKVRKVGAEKQRICKEKHWR